jgi:hypothetical protein
VPLHLQQKAGIPSPEKMQITGNNRGAAETGSQVTAHTTIPSHQFGEWVSRAIPSRKMTSCGALPRSGWPRTTFVTMKGWWGLDPNRSAARLLRRLPCRCDRSAFRCRHLDASPFPRATILTGHYSKRSWRVLGRCNRSHRLFDAIHPRTPARLVTHRRRLICASTQSEKKIRFSPGARPRR